MSFAKPTPEQLAQRYAELVPTGDQSVRYHKIRSAIFGAAVIAVENTPCSPEQTRALNALDEALFLFHAAIARGE